MPIKKITVIFIAVKTKLYKPIKKMWVASMKGGGGAGTLRIRHSVVKVNAEKSTINSLSTSLSFLTAAINV